MPVGTDAGHAHRMVRASSRGERIPSSTSPAIWTDGRPVAHVRIGANGLSIRHQVNGREKRIGNLPVDGWCAQTRTAYQFHGCFWHGCPKCHEPEETNPKNGKTMAVLLADTKKHNAYLLRHVKVIEMWECPPTFRSRWTMTQQQIIAAVVDGTLFGIIKCDVRVPSELRAHFAEMQPIFKNATVTRDDIGTSMREYAEKRMASCRHRAAC